MLSVPLLSRINEIDNAAMILHGEKAHSLYFGMDVFKILTQDWKAGTPNNKVLHVVPGASHCDLYDRTDIIPFDEIVKFYSEYLK